MATPFRSTKEGTLPVVLLILYFVVSYILWHPSHFTVACESGGDISVFALGVERAKDFRAFVGPYSRFGFCHPGPTFFYLYAAGEWLFSSVQPHAAHRLTQLLLNMTLLGLVACNLPVRARSVGRAIMVVVALVGFRLVRADILETTWNPASVIMPFLLYVILGARITLGSVELIPLWLFAGTLALHNHVATAVPLLVVGSFTIVSLYLGQRPSLGKLITPFNLAILGACLVFNLLPIYEVLVDESGGNLGAFLAFRAQSSPNKSAWEVVLFAGRFLSPLSLFGIRNQVAGVTLIALSVAWCWYDAKTAGADGRRALWRTVGVAYLAACASAFLVEGRLYPYLMWSTLGLVSLVWWSLIECAWICLKTTASGNHLMRYGKVVLLLGLLALAFLPTIPPMKVLGCGDRVTKFHARLAEFSKEDIRFVLHGQSLWMYVASFYLDLVRQNRTVCIDGRWWHVFGKDSRCREGAQVRAQQQGLVDVHFFPEREQIKTNQPIMTLGPLQVVITPPVQD